MQELIPKEIESAEKDKVSYEILWTIPNWTQVRQNVRLVKNLKAIFKTGPDRIHMIQTKWLVGFKDNFTRDGFRVGVYWQLMGIKGSGSQLTLDASLKTVLCSASDGYIDIIDEQSLKISLGEIVKEKKDYLHIEERDLGNSVRYIHSSGAIKYKLLLTFKIPDNDLGPSYTKKLKLEQFSKRSHSQLRENLATLSKDLSNGDLKIITSDGVELRAFQTILRAQCPVFAGMLNSDLSESKTGIVNVEDICGKTMRILLHYFHTGDLLDDWNDPDTIVEYTYAAGKYQVTQVLELLDDLFGRSDLNEVSNLDVQLLNLAGKLSLKNAEKRLLQQIIGKVAASKSGEELFKLFGYDSEEVSSKVETLAGEPMVESKVLEILNYAVGNTTQHMDFSERGLVLLALVQRNGSLKDLEQVLLKKIAEVTSKFTTAEELTDFFGGDGRRG